MIPSKHYFNDPFFWQEQRWKVRSTNINSIKTHVFYSYLVLCTSYLIRQPRRLPQIRIILQLPEHKVSNIGA
jgi:hypothetical protein